MISNEQQNYYFTNGRIALFERLAGGATGKGVFTGNSPDFKITLTTENKEHFESMSGKNVKDRDVITQVGAEFAMTLESLTEDNLALLVWGVKQSIASAASQSYVIDNPEIGGLYRIPNGFNLSAVAVEDTADASALVEGTHYEIENAFGAIKILSLTGVTGDVEVNYTRGAATAVPFFTGVRPHRFGSFHGKNKGNETEKNVLVELYDMVFNPVTDLSLITDDFGKYELKGSCLVDITKEADPAFGGFGRKLYL